MSGVKRWWVFKEQLLDEKVHRFDSDGAIPVVLASDYDAEVAAHEMTAHELKCAEANWDNLRLACDEKERVGDAFLVRAEKAEAERDDLRNYASQCSLNADNANTSLGCACDELKEMREAFGLVSTLAPHRIADPSHPIDWAKGIVKDVEAERDNLRLACDEKERVGDAFLVRAEKAEAERDRLAGVVERVKDLHRWLKESGTHANEALNLGNVLADPVSETFTRLNSYGVPYESRNGRGLTGHDARGRRHEDTHNCVRYTPLTWDRRKRTRRGGRRK